MLHSRLAKQTSPTMANCEFPVPPRKPRVLVLTSTFPRWVGDSEPAFVFSLCQQLAHQFEICVLAPHAPGALADELFFENVRVVRYRYFFARWETLAYSGGVMANLRSNRWRYFLVAPFILGQVVALLRLLFNHRFDVLHAHWLFPQGAVAALLKYLRVGRPRLVCTAHGTDIHGLHGSFFTLMKRFAVAQSDAFTVVSDALLQSARQQGIDVRAASVIPMGVDAKRLFTPHDHTPRAALQLLCVGRLDERKGFGLLVATLPAVLAVYPECVLKIVGSGPQEGALRAQVADLGVALNVEFVGSVPNTMLPTYYREATVLVFPSTGSEGLGLVCAEALACECPVVAADQASVQEVVEHGVSGFVFRSGDMRDLAVKLLRLLADPVLRAKMGSAGRKHVLARYDWEQVAASFARVLQGKLER